MPLAETLLLLRRTRRLTIFATLFLGLQLSGNLYEEIVTNPSQIVSPRPGALVSAIGLGSPLYFYLPWVPMGIVLAVWLAFRLSEAPGWVGLRMRWAMASLAVATIVKAYLISSVNPRFRDPSEAAEVLRSLAIQWEFLNGLAIVAVALALWLMLTWRAKLLDEAALAS